MVKRTKKNRRKKKTISKKKGGGVFRDSPNEEIYKLMIRWFKLLGKTKLNQKTGKEDLKNGSNLHVFLGKLPGILHGEKLKEFVKKVTVGNSKLKTGAVSSNSELKSEDESEPREFEYWWANCLTSARYILEIGEIVDEELDSQAVYMI